MVTATFTPWVTGIIPSEFLSIGLYQVGAQPRSLNPMAR